MKMEFWRGWLHCGRSERQKWRSGEGGCSVEDILGAMKDGYGVLERVVAVGKKWEIEIELWRGWL